MSNNNQDWYEEDDFEFEDYSDSEQPQRGRKDEDVLTKVRRSERAKDKELKALKSELESLRKFQRETTVTQVLSEKGIDPRISKFIPADIETSVDSISSWLNENGELFGFTKTDDKPAISQEEISALRQMEMVTSGASNPDGVNDLYSAINNAQSEEELLNIISQLG